jgi:predicted glycosyltransferase
MKLKRKPSLKGRDGGKMKIWYDACTGKHVRYGTAIARRLRRLGHEVLLTTRKHPDTLALAKTLNEKFISVGEYEPATLFTRLEASAKRIVELSRMVQDSVPDVALSSQSVELCRVAFGLNIPIILTADTPHATAVNKLTIPFASILVVSEAIPRRLFNRYGMAKIFQFRGVDEVAWIKDLMSPQKFEVKKPLIVVRQMETAAAYALGKTDVTKKIALKLASLGNVLFLPRYDKSEKEGLTVAKEFVDSASLVANADLVVSVGGTIAREAALQGVPSIVISEFGRTYVNKYLSDKEFPLFITNAAKVFTMAKAHIGRKWDVKEKLARLENPVDVIEKIITEKHFC